MKRRFGTRGTGHEHVEAKRGSVGRNAVGDALLSLFYEGGEFTSRNVTPDYILVCDELNQLDVNLAFGRPDATLGGIDLPAHETTEAQERDSRQEFRTSHRPNENGTDRQAVT